MGRANLRCQVSNVAVQDPARDIQDLTPARDEPGRRCDAMSPLA
jgi:hypothetical protein